MSPRTAIDLTADPSETVAPPPTLSQEEGQAAPEEQEKAQDWPKLLGRGWKDPVRVKWVSWDHWEELQDPLKFVTQQS